MGEAGNAVGQTALNDDEHVGFIESNESAQFLVTPDSRYWYTQVPSLKRMLATYETVTSFKGGLTTVDLSGEFLVFYKDPQVLRVPDELGGGWLMLLARARVLIEDLGVGDWEDLVKAARDLETVAGGKVLSDIVAFHSRSELFRGADVRGPFLVVDSLLAIKSEAGEPVFRTWLGAPGGAFHHDGDAWSLYVYYNVERAWRQEDPNDNTTRPLMFDRFVSVGELEAAYARQGFERCVGVQSVAGAVVEWALAHAPPDEATRTRASAWPGRLNQAVRHWVSSAPVPARYIAMTEYIRALVEALPVPEAEPEELGDPDEVNPRYADPAALVVEGRLEYFIAIAPTNYRADGNTANIEATPEGDTGFGLWRFTAAASGVVLGGGIEAVFGRDVVARGGPTHAPRDQLAPVYLAEGVVISYTDPDPVLVDDGRTPRLWVYGLVLEGNAPEHLVRFDQL